MSDNGLVYGFLLDGQGGAKAFDLQDAANWKPEDGIVWLHFDYTNDNARQWIEQEAQLDDLVVEALLTGESRPRTTPMGDGLLVALRGVNLSPGSNPEDMVGIRIWTDGKRIISTRRRRLLSASDLVEQLNKGEGPCTAGEFLIMLSDRLMARMQGTIDDTEDSVASIEEEILSAGGYNLRSQIASLRREVISLRRYLSPQREAMLQMQTVKVSWLKTDERQSLREVTDHLIRYVEDLDSVRDRAAVAQEELANRLAEDMNNRMYVLSLVAAVFLPLGFLTGLLGINVGGIPGAENPLSFWIFCFLLVTLVGFQVWIFKRKSWF